MTEQVGWLAGLTLIGFVLITLEVFLPGAVLGILGGCCLLGSIGMAFAVYGISGGFLAILILLILGFIFTPLLIKYAPHTPFAKMLTLSTSNEGFKSAPAEYKAYVGQSGVARSVLRPSGTATIGTDRVDVVSESGHIAAGTPIRVTKVEGMRIVVEPVEGSEPVAS